jgi:hypothetical protein
VTGCKSTKPFSCVWQNPIDYAYDSLVLPAKHPKNITICGVTFKNKDNGALFQDVRRLTLNCDSTFNWKHISCINRDTSFGNWTIKNKAIYLTSSKTVKRKVEKQELGNLFGEYIDLSNTNLVFNDSFIVWQRDEKWTDTLYRH